MAGAHRSRLSKERTLERRQRFSVLSAVLLCPVSVGASCQAGFLFLRQSGDALPYLGCGILSLILILECVSSFLRAEDELERE